MSENASGHVWVRWLPYFRKFSGSPDVGNSGRLEIDGNIALLESARDVELCLHAPKFFHGPLEL